jgi:acetolactate synthase-1/2/3 large subunit
VIEKDINPDNGKLRMPEIIHKLSEKTSGDAIIVTDVGQHQMATARYYKFNSPNSLITSGGLGTMGFGLPAAFGASMAAPDKHVVLIVGDGGLQMTIQELATIRQHNANIKIVVLNNSFLGMVRQWQELFMEKRYSFTNMENPDFVKIAEGYGIRGKKVKTVKGLENAFEDMFLEKGPYFLEIETEKEDNVFPMVPAGASVSDIILEPQSNS